MKKNITTTLLSLLLLFFYAPLWAQFLQMGNDIDGEAAGDESGYSVSMPDANTLAIGAPGNDDNSGNVNDNRGHVRIYSWNSASGTWLQKGAEIDGEAADDWSGYSVSMPDANTVAIGARYNDSGNPNNDNRGHVRIYSWNSASGTWGQKGGDIDGETTGDYSGSSVSMPDANTVAIGATGNGGNGNVAGHVRIYSWDFASGTWLQKGADIDGEAAVDNSGASVSMPDANTVAIGAHNNGGNGLDAGHVRIYSWDSASGTWTQKGADIDGEAAGDNSGRSVSMPDANTVAIGAPYNDGNGSFSGHVRIYSWDSASGTWLQKGGDINGEAAGDYSGYSVSMPDANTVAIGAYLNDGNGTDAGHVRIYSWNSASGTWLQVGTDIDGEVADDLSGASVSMPDANTLAIGAPVNDGNGTESGHVRVYKLTGIYGYTYQDFNQDCLQNSLEIGLANRMLILNPGNILLQTGSTGSWYIDSLPVGTYTLTADTSSPIWQLTCPVTQSFTITNPDSLIFAPSFGYISNYPCTAPDVSIHAPFLRLGFSDQRVYVQACNTPTASEILDSAYIIVELDALMTVDSGSMAYTALGNHQYRVNIGDLYPGQCAGFWLSTTLSTSAILGQTLCMNAELYPVDSCALDSIPNPYLGTVSPCTLPWDRSSLQVEATCVNDSVRFVIYNTGVFGGGDMDCFAPVRVYLDGQYILLDSIQLQGGDSIVFMFAGNGQTWRLEADQHPLHPGNSQPNATIENCGTGTWTPNLVNILPMDDADPIIDIYCGLVTGSYDPNDKTGFPLGVGTEHDILPNQKLEYLIRFQNTGTDTAFNIVIRDTLSTDFNIFTVKSGVSSHNHSFRMYGPRVLEWTFSNIMLPDSNVNEPASHGFVKFEVQQNPNLPNGTLLENSAAIYFDFNAPIFTNTSSHTINNNPLLITHTQKIELERGLQILLYPNPTTGQFTLDLGGLQGSVTVTISNLMGQTLSTQTYTGQSQINLRLEAASGLYLVRVQNEKGAEATMKVLKQ